MKKILLLVPDGVGIKNYLFSDVFKNVNYEVSLLHDFDDKTLLDVQQTVNFHKSHKLSYYKESLKEKFFRELIHLSRLKYNARRVHNKSILKSWNPKKKNFQIALFYKLIHLTSLVVIHYKFILFLEKYYQKLLKKNKFYNWSYKFLEEEKPDIIFCTHQRALKAPTIFNAAKELDIKSITVIYSWDNVPKARLALKADYYFVWSKHMYEELIQFYPEIGEDQIEITGTPQFEFYAKNDNIIDKNHFYDKYSLDINKKLICFSGDDVKTSPYDPDYLEDVAESIIANNMENDYQIVFRRCPVDISGRFDEVVKKYKNVIREIPPLWNFNNDGWTTVYPLHDDVKLLVSLCYYSDTVINVGSTMAFDFGMFEKPCIFINYDQQEAKNWSVETIYNYQHFRSMPDKNAVIWLNSKEEIKSSLLKAISKNGVDIKSWFDKVIEDPNMASHLIKEKLKTI
ncbi:UDP-glycosyltransferase [Flavobacteriaceae bacterium R38]|nr:UDP-glycosyltransferase [Flavobacteriaceae bacterium R38]